jgi:hypothetical protein
VTDEASGRDEDAPESAPTIRCEQCGQEVPALRFCIRCGDPLDAEHRRGRSGRVREGYAAAPEERAAAVRLISTIYPALPREEIRTFQLALLAGGLLVVLLGLVGFFPVAVVAAAVLVPLLTITYLYDVDTYEDQPVRVVALTFVWGLVAGAIFAIVIDRMFPVQAADVLTGTIAGGGGGEEFPWVRGVIAPLIAGALMAAGPLLLLGQKRFNDVLDGATFGVTSAVAFTAAQTLVTSISLFQSGLQPGGDPVPWVVRLVGIGVATPVIAAGAIGGLLAVLWLRHRSPDDQEGMLGPLGNPIVAMLLAAALLVANALVQVLLKDEQTPTQVIQLLLQVAIAVVALLWLRRVIHVGLLQESLEIPVGPEIACANCGRPTPSHTFCGECGVSLRALPKARPATAGVAAASASMGDLAAPHEVSTAPDTIPGGVPGAALQAIGGPATVGDVPVPAPAAHGWLGPSRLLVVFGLLLGAIVVVSLVVAYVISQGLDRPTCPDPSVPCAGQTDGVPFPPLATYTDPDVGFSFDYDGSTWTVAQQGAGAVVLTAFQGAVGYIVETAPVSAIDVQGVFDYRRGQLAQRLLGFDDDEAPARRLIGTPILGHRPGIAGLFTGALDSPQGPSVDFTAAAVAATDGQIAAVATILVPRDGRDIGLNLADTINNSFRWPTDPVVE